MGWLLLRQQEIVYGASGGRGVGMGASSEWRMASFFWGEQYLRQSSSSTLLRLRLNVSVRERKRKCLALALNLFFSYALIRVIQQHHHYSQLNNIAFIWLRQMISSNRQHTFFLVIEFLPILISACNYIKSCKLALLHFESAFASSSHVHLNITNLFLKLFILILLVDELEEMSVFVLDICQFVGHFSLQQQVAKVSLLQKPSVEFTKGALAIAKRSCLIWLPFKQLRQVARTSYILHLTQIVASTFSEAAAMLVGEFLHLLLVVSSDELPDYLLRYVATNILIIVTFALHLLLLNFLEYPQPARRLLDSGSAFIYLCGVWLAENDVMRETVKGIPYKGTITIGDFIEMWQKFANEGVCGLAARDVKKHLFLVGVHTLRVLQVNIFLLFRVIKVIIHRVLICQQYQKEC